VQWKFRDAGRPPLYWLAALFNCTSAGRTDSRTDVRTDVRTVRAGLSTNVTGKELGFVLQGSFFFFFFGRLSGCGISGTFESYERRAAIFTEAVTSVAVALSLKADGFMLLRSPDISRSAGARHSLAIVVAPTGSATGRNSGAPKPIRG
jgi:hypothetical protein